MKSVFWSVCTGGNFYIESFTNGQLDITANADKAILFDKIEGAIDLINFLKIERDMKCFLHSVDL